ncbi:hypothetical protein R3P38DRAFT_2771033 [Favolaschia claudopus]|uniref:Uncharacterized protein n=1 Tax=Favolaschia claudopus TaxID=2862362 RepID=A0AAW0CDH8_9AGAR
MTVPLYFSVNSRRPGTPEGLCTSGLVHRRTAPSRISLYFVPLGPIGAGRQLMPYGGAQGGGLGVPTGKSYTPSFFPVQPSIDSMHDLNGTLASLDLDRELERGGVGGPLTITSKIQILGHLIRTPNGEDPIRIQIRAFSR